jgi:hypothetical protein
MIDEKKIEEWQRLADAATPGPWATGAAGEVFHQTETDGRRWVANGYELKDQEFIASARTAVPELIAELRRLRGRYTVDVIEVQEGRQRAERERDALRAEVERLRGKLVGFDKMDEEFAKLADRAIAARDAVTAKVAALESDLAARTAECERLRLSERHADRVLEAKSDVDARREAQLDDARAQLAAVTAERDRLRAAWGVFIKAASLDHLHPEHHGDAVLRVLREAGGKAFETNRQLNEQIHAMQPVVEAAQALTDQVKHEGRDYFNTRSALCEAVDAYERAQKGGG